MVAGSGPSGLGPGNRPLAPVQPGGLTSGGGQSSGKVGPSFARILGQQQAVKFSAHASERLQGRPISAEEMSRINTGIQKAASKGAKDSLLLMSDLALVVNVPNRTVVTAVGGERLKEGVFTNIDSAVIV